MNKVRLLKNAKATLRILCPHYYVSFSSIKNNNQIYRHPSWRFSRLLYLNRLLEPIKYISNYSSMQTKDSDSASETNDNEKIRKILDDEDFQNILKDFANDFGVDNETNELLDDIRKNIDEDYEESNLPSAKHTINDDKNVLGGGLDHRYKEFSDADSTVIHSYEERNDAFVESEHIYHIDHELRPKLPYSDIKRGITGVFDLDEMIEVLHNEGLMDVTAISIPKELHYADFLVLATAKSPRHSDGVAESINKLYKLKKEEKDPFVKIEGKNVSEWKVMDMGNIVLHIFLEETRALYDLESLWLLDSKYDSGGNAQQDPMLNIMEEQMEFFNSLNQSNTSEASKDPS